MTSSAILPVRFSEHVRQRLSQRLPGRAALRRLEPDLSYGRHCHAAPASARSAAVLVLLYPHEQAWHVPLTLRPATMAEHAGQVSFPGGLVETGEDTACAALREYEEELGAKSGDVELLGTLSPLFLFVSNYAVTPWVGIVPERPDFSPNPSEVADLLEVSLEHLANPANQRHGLQGRGHLKFRAPSYAFGEHDIWGATGMMLSELVAVLEGIR